MSDIRAFVGHSFAEDDAKLVRKFLDYFGRLSQAMPNFTWDHAEPAEPRHLAEKVMSVISDKNVFIGICTRNEKVIQPNSLRKASIWRRLLCADRGQFHWKTSDWIIQEIGLAKGLTLDLILLVENGVRKPGGLQGDVEYIEFDRDAPEASFLKIVEMLSALSPARPGPSPVSSQPNEAQSEDEGKPDEQSERELLVPKPEWDRNDYEMAFIYALRQEDTSKSEAIANEYLKTEEATEEERKYSWNAFCELARLTAGKGGSLRNLIKLSEDCPSSSEVLEFLAEGYEVYEDYLKSAETYLAASRVATDDTRALDLMGRAAEKYEQANIPDKATELIRKMKSQVAESFSGGDQVLKGLKTLTERRHEDDANLAIMERMVEIDPSDIKMRFSLAYKYSDCDEEELSLYHYLKIPQNDRDPVTWNNIGVALDRLSLPAKSVDAYRKSEKSGETLAASNIAYKFIGAGFLSEAKKLCRDAQQTLNYNDNINHALAKLIETADKENRAVRETLRKAKPRSEFYKRFGLAVCQTEPKGLASNWKGPDCLLEVTLRDLSFSAVGWYEQPVSQPFAALMNTFGTTNRKVKPIRFRVEYSGTLHGRAIEARVQRSKEGDEQVRPHLLGYSDESAKALMVLSDDESTFTVMEFVPKKEPLFYELKRQSPDD